MKGNLDLVFAEIDRAVTRAGQNVESGALHSRSERLKHQIERGRRNLLLAADEDAAAMCQHLDELRQQQRDVERQLRSCQRRNVNAAQIRRRARKALVDIEARFGDGDPLKMREVLACLFDRIVLHFTRRGRNKPLDKAIVVFASV